MSKHKKITFNRVCRNLARMARSCTPPVLLKALGLARLGQADSERDSGITTDQTCVAESQVAEFLIPKVSPNEIWHEFDQTEVTMLPRQLRDHLWAMPENELLILSTICRVLQPKSVFEFGTFTGASTLAIAANTPPSAEIHTLDIPPEDRRSHRTGVGSDIPFDYEIGQVFKGTNWESKITIHQADTRRFDVSAYRKKMDLVFVDADHTFQFAKNDTEKALEMLAPGGVILWHDYRWDDTAPECVGVTQVVDAFHSTQGRCHEIANTRFAIFQSGVGTDSEVAA